MPSSSRTQTWAASPWVTCTQNDGLGAGPAHDGRRQRLGPVLDARAPPEPAPARPSVSAGRPSAPSTATSVCSGTGTPRPVQSWYSVATPQRWASSASVGSRSVMRQSCLVSRRHVARQQVGTISGHLVPYCDAVPSTRDRRARVAVAALFVTNGALFANLVPRYPEIKAELGLSNTGFGLSMAAFSAGALLSGLTAGMLIRRCGSARVAVVSTLRSPCSPRRRGGAEAGGFRRRTVRRRRLRRGHRCRAERPGLAGATQLRALDHQLAARDVVGRCGRSAG